MSHYAVATMKKMKAENLSGMLRHDFRETKNHKNKDIDPNKSDQNIELVADHKLHKQDIVDYINKRRRSSRKLRRDAVMVDEWIISSDREFFDTGHSERNEGYFKSALAYFQQKFGSENVMYASVHYDETTPHMHMGIVPMTKDGKLSSKQVFDRNTLRTIQTEFPRYMQEQGYEVVRGSENSQRRRKVKLKTSV
uniref:MobV family relaxase n=1 Tax=Limosilactobacillus reuteri TaxID=1598 RepID=UPI003D8116E9